MNSSLVLPLAASDNILDPERLEVPVRQLIAAGAYGGSGIEVEMLDIYGHVNQMSHLVGRGILNVREDELLAERWYTVNIDAIRWESEVLSN